MKKPVQEEKGERAPIWIISFADMISLLMAFFVMLLTMTNEQSGKLCNTGTGIEAFELTLVGFRRMVAGFGLPDLFGTTVNNQSFGSHKPHYAVGPPPDDTDDVSRIVDASEEHLKRIFDSLESRAKTLRSQIEGQKPEFISVPVTFAANSVVLDESAQRFLSDFAADIEQAAAGEQFTLYVVGLASGQADERQRWIISAQRARVVAEFLRAAIPQGLSDKIYSWGAGQGGDWTASDSPASANAQILIAVIRAGG
jgi:outer membrane protein OmpA-like peptidoglycan-associated protein